MPHSLIWSTDPHLDHAPADTVEHFLAALRRTPGAAVILTGDLSTAPHLIVDLERIADAAERPVYHVLGNHDHFGGTVSAVRDAVVSLAERRPAIQWLPPAGVITLEDDLALVGVDGWADGRHGDPLNTPLRLNDDRLIGEFASLPSRLTRLAAKRALADADAARLDTLLTRAAPGFQRILVATHVPPFIEALPTRGPIARPEWQPLLVCGATGAVLRQFAQTHPDHQVTVLCGHSHAPADVAIAPNLRCVVGGARYGSPRAVSFTP